MRAMVLHVPHQPLVLEDDELLIRVNACGVCRTDLHIQDGDLPHSHFPLILGHEIGGACDYCQTRKENLCEKGEYTGYTQNGGFAEYTTCKADFAIHLPESISDVHLAPLLCTGLIGYRAYKKAAPEKTLGIFMGSVL